ncbi:hypothetical protein BGZ46_008371 [Entomortierella lignicola]|nr:hypothetical protein BGZ46_008371 [Entomortierella lignicola]
MSLTSKNPLEVPEILKIVGEYIPLWGWDMSGRLVFLPKDLIKCLLVSRHFHNTLLPVLWHTYDIMAMRTVPSDLILKYGAHVRILNHFGFTVLNRGFHEFISPPQSIFENCTNLIEYVGDEGITEDTLHKNQGLLRLVFKRYHGRESFTPIYQGLGDNFHHLKVLDLVPYTQMDGREARSILRHLAPKLVELHMPNDNFLMNLGEDEEELVLTKVKVLHIKARIHSSRNISAVCPNIENLDTSLWDRNSPSSDDLDELLRSELCPELRSLTICTSNLQQNMFVSILEAHPGLWSLGIVTDAGTNKVQQAITQHSGTLKHFKLQISGNNWDTSFFTNISRSCNGLTSVEIYNWPQPIEELLQRSNWMNPMALESVCLRWDNTEIFLRSISATRTTQIDTKESSIEILEEGFPQVGWGISLAGKRLKRDKIRYEASRRDERSTQEDSQIFFNWKVHGGKMDLKILSLIHVFKLATRFPNLRRITLNNMRFKKVRSS